MEVARVLGGGLVPGMFCNSVHDNCVILSRPQCIISLSAYCVIILDYKSFTLVRLNDGHKTVKTF